MAFDPVRQKNLADSAFDLGVAGFFGEEEMKAGAGVEDDDEEGPVDDPDEDDGSVGDGSGFEVQDDQFADEGTTPRGAFYEVVFTAPTQFGMLLEVSKGAGPFLGSGSAYSSVVVSQTSSSVCMADAPIRCVLCRAAQGRVEPRRREAARADHRDAGGGGRRG